MANPAAPNPHGESGGTESAWRIRRRRHRRSAASWQQADIRAIARLLAPLSVRPVVDPHPWRVREQAAG
ncbi:hypothetical protein ABZU86_09265 [Streptomyces sp. NPDC005271]|uniref:hypothetical protein n=1 Tax=Streptomyces sp. NPDC005271 TaxID=3157030 RepID=UPI0033AA2D47